MNLRPYFRKFSRQTKVALLGWLGGFLLDCLFRSITWVRNDFTDSSKLDLSKPIIAAFWHGRQLLLGPLFFHAKLPVKVKMLISAHTDGRIIARASNRFNIDATVGSSSRGGARAFMGLVRAIEEGFCVGITPDGPRGPARACKDGVIKLAQLTGAPIVPMSVSASNYWRFKSWDQMILPKPFSKGVCVVGDPIEVPRTLEQPELDRIKERLSLVLRELDDLADSYE